MIWVGRDEACIGTIALRDQVLPTTHSLFERFEAEKIQTVMLSGDSEATTTIIAREIGITNFHGNCPPEGKARCIQSWQKSGEKVAMIRDGRRSAI